MQVQVQCDALPTRQVQSFSPVRVRVDEKADAAGSRCSLNWTQLVLDAAGMHDERKNAHVWHHEALFTQRAAGDGDFTDANSAQNMCRCASGYRCIEQHWEGAPISCEMRVFSLKQPAAHRLHHMLGSPQTEAKPSNHREDQNLLQGSNKRPS